MKDNSAISFGMPTKRGDQGANEQREAELRAFGERVAEAAESLGLSFKAIGELAGVSEATAWRVRQGTASLRKAMAVRSALLAKGARLPPLTFGGADASMEETLGDGSDVFATPEAVEWARLGEELRNADRTQYARVVRGIKKFLDAKRIVERGILSIGDPLPDEDE